MLFYKLTADETDCVKRLGEVSDKKSRKRKIRLILKKLYEFDKKQVRLN
jgi:hypothetical protein